MKKLAAALVAFVLAAGLAAVATPAQAAPYPNSVATYCSVHFQDNSVRYRHRNPVYYKVTTAGTARPHTGVVRITAVNKHHRYTRTWDYSGGHRYHAFRAMKRGKYTVTMTHKAPRNSAYQNCRKHGHSVRVR
jgi:hypothetical protein